MINSNITKMKNMHYQYKADAEKSVGLKQRLINKSKAEAIKEVLEKLFNVEVI